MLFRLRLWHLWRAPTTADLWATLQGRVRRRPGYPSPLLLPRRIIRITRVGRLAAATSHGATLQVKMSWSMLHEGFLLHTTWVLTYLLSSLSWLVLHLLTILSSSLLIFLLLAFIRPASHLLFSSYIFLFFLPPSPLIFRFLSCLITIPFFTCPPLHLTSPHIPSPHLSSPLFASLHFPILIFHLRSPVFLSSPSRRLTF